ncbi:MAG: Lin1244/Lin1753 domain-containing protein [Bacteroidota bacterium]
MKWFHHECAARYDSKLQILGSKHGAEGIGIYWGLLEEIGQHSDTFHLKVIGVDEGIDQKYSELLQSSKKSQEVSSELPPDLTRIPVLPVKILSRNLFTSPKRVMQTIKTAAEIGLFDLQKWLEFNVLYSQSFEQRADDYTRRLQRRTDKVRIDSEQSPNDVRTPFEETPNTLQSKSQNVHTETEAKAETETKKELDTDMHARDKSESKKNEIDYEFLKNEPYLIELDETGFQEYCRTFRSKIVKWNAEHRSKFNWNPADDELRKIFLGGTQERKISMCYDAYKILHEKIHYPELVIRALQLMLKASEKTRIANPFGWLWTCLHGNGDGTTPWVQLLTAAEESNVGSILRKRTTTSHPP